ncbi:MAG: hypothetical protein IT426_20980 [Pirellulales bacterium]|nr:hypothetical protein [Pirellulales bacterium]
MTIAEKLISISEFCREKRFAILAENIERALAAAGVSPREIGGKKFYPEIEVDRALGTIVRENLNAAQAARSN